MYNEKQKKNQIFTLMNKFWATWKSIWEMKVMTLETFPDPKSAQNTWTKRGKRHQTDFQIFRKKTKSNVNQQLWSHIKIHLGNESYDLGDLPRPQISPEYLKQEG